MDWNGMDNGIPCNKGQGFRWHLLQCSTGVIMWKLSATLVCFLMCAVAHLTFTNLKCQMIDRQFGLFEKCLIKAVNRTHKYVDISTKIYKFPVDNVTLKLLPMRHDHGYRPFFVNLTFDVGGFFRNLQNENGPKELILRELFQTVKAYTNINHTCPYYHDVEISKLWTGNLEARFLRYLPMPQGDYSLSLNWYTSRVNRATVKVYFRLTDR